MISSSVILLTDAWAAALEGMAALVNEVRKAPIEPGMPVPPILIVCPPEIRSPKGSIVPEVSRRGEEMRGACRCVWASGFRSPMFLL